MRAPPRDLGFLAVSAAGLTALAVVAVVVHLWISSLALVGVRSPTVNCPTVENRWPTVPDDVAAPLGRLSRERAARCRG